MERAFQSESMGTTAWTAPTGTPWGAPSSGQRSGFRGPVPSLPSGGSVRPRGCRSGAALALLTLGVLEGVAGEFRWAPEKPTLDRWNYPFNFEAATRPVAPTYGSFDPRFDTRDAELLLGWDTGSALSTGRGPAQYLLRAVAVTLTSVAPVPPILPFVYDPTYDSYRTYLRPGTPEAEADADPGRPIELYGVGYRGGFTAETYLEGSPFGPLGPISGGNISIGTRNAYGFMFDTNGAPLDVANNVGQMNPAWTNAPFEVRPWAIGTTTNTVPGGDMPDGATMRFALDLRDPLVAGYLQRALNEGRIRLMVSSLSPAGQSTPGGTGVGGVGAYPWWSNKENLVYDPPRIEVEGTLVTDADEDADGLPDDWERHFFGGLSSGSAAADADGDGATDRAEYDAGTDPTVGTSVLRILGWGGDMDGDGAAGRLWVRFPVAPSRMYQVESSRDLVRWETLEGGRMTYPESGVAVWMREAAPAEPGIRHRFLRVRAVPER